MKKTIAMILAATLMASVLASCGADPEPTRVSSAARETTATTAEEPTTTTSDLVLHIPDGDGLVPLREGEHAISEDLEATYYEAFLDLDELPGSPVALIAETDDGNSLIIENGGYLSYSGATVYHVTKVGRSEYGAFSGTIEYLDVLVGMGDSDMILNLPDSYEITDELRERFEEYAPEGYDDLIFYAAHNAVCDVFAVNGDDNTLVFISIDNDGNSEIILTYDYSDLL